MSPGNSCTKRGYLGDVIIIFLLEIIHNIMIPILRWCPQSLTWFVIVFLYLCSCEWSRESLFVVIIVCAQCAQSDSFGPNKTILRWCPQGPTWYLIVFFAFVLLRSRESLLLLLVPNVFNQISGPIKGPGWIRPFCVRWPETDNSGGTKPFDQWHCRDWRGLHQPMRLSRVMTCENDPLL